MGRHARDRIRAHRTDGRTQPGALQHDARSRLDDGVLCQDFLARNQQVYEAMWGPSEFFATGVLADWNIEPRLGEIDVPTLIVSGRYDEATPAQQQRLKEGIRGSQWTMLDHSAHLTFVEQPERYGEILTSFLDAVEAGNLGSAKSLA